MKRLTFALLLAAAAGILAGCTSASPLSQPTFDTLPGGIVRVRNSGPSAWADTNGWKLKLERTIRPEEGSPGELGNGGMIVADELRGEIFVLDRGPAVIKRFRTDGTFLGTIGRQGSGPGEFGDYGILYLIGDTLVHHDQSLGRLTVFTHTGEFVRVTSGVSHVGMELASDTRGRIPLPIDRPLPDGRSQEGVVRYRLDGTIVDTLWYPLPFAGKDWTVERPNISAGMAVPFTPVRITHLDREGDLFWGQQDEGRFVVSRTGTDTIRLIEAAFPSLRLSDAERQATFDTALTQNKWLAGTARLEDIPSERLRWDTVAVDGAGDLWVRRSATPDRRFWSVLGPDGRWLGDVPAPFGDVAAWSWAGNRVYILTTDSAGIPQIGIWRIDTTKP